MSSGGVDIHPVVRQILRRIGVTEKSDVQSFLYPQLNKLPQPSRMLDLEKGAALIGKGILANHPILVWGDYDVDGVTSTALLMQFFSKIGYSNVQYYIPNRLREGYGLQPDALQEITATTDLEQEKILITVDNGISAHNGVEMAKQLGYTVVITDHHLAPTNGVQADAVINPSQNECPFPEKALAGVGVAFYLMIALRAFLSSANYFTSNKNIPNLKQFLGLVALGTVADLMPMQSINRILVRGGFESVANKDNIGLSSLCAKSNLDHTTLRSEDVAFLLAPKINAAGRLGNADLAVNLLTATDKTTADRLAIELNALNETRKDRVLHDIAKAEDKQCDLFHVSESIVLAAGDFHVGVAGIVAAKLVEMHNKPAFVLCISGELYKGSARSIAGIHIHSALKECDEFLIGYGGHAMAAGMSLDIKSLDMFTNALSKSVLRQMESEYVEQAEDTCFDFPISDMFKGNLLEQFLLLEPHGIGNPQPIFRDHRVDLQNIKRIGKDKTHLSFTINNASTKVYGIGFGLGELYERCSTSEPKSIRYSPTLNYFNGRRRWQARVVDIEPSRV